MIYGMVIQCLCCGILKKEFQKRVASEFGVNVVILLSDVKENRHAAKGYNLLAEKQKDFHTKMY